MNTPKKHSAHLLTFGTPAVRHPTPPVPESQRLPPLPGTEWRRSKLHVSAFHILSFMLHCIDVRLAAKAYNITLEEQPKPGPHL